VMTKGTDREVASDDHALWRLVELFRDDLNGLHDMIEGYLHDAVKLIAQMQKAVQKGDLSQLATAAHTLKANALVFGETALVKVCNSLEMAPRSATKENLENLLRQLVNEQDRARVMLLARYRVLMSALTRR